MGILNPTLKLTIRQAIRKIRNKKKTNKVFGNLIFELYFKTFQMLGKLTN